MISNFLIAMLAVPLLLTGWLVVQSIARLFARRHPEFGQAREEGGGCGSSCLCSKGHCRNRSTGGQE